MGANPIITAFSEEHVERLTGLSKGQLRSWDRAGFFAPHYAYEDRKSPYSRIYSFQDVVGLRTIAVLKKDFGVSIQELKRVAAELSKRGYGHWSTLKLYVLKGKVHFQIPGTADIEGVWDGQRAMLPVIDVISDVETRARDLKKRTADQYGKVEKHRHVVRNSAVIAGTRIPVAAIRRFKEAGYSVEQILGEYPTLTATDVEAALDHKERLARSA